MNPLSSRRDKLVHFIFRAFQIWRQDGFKGLWQGSVNRIARNNTYIAELADRKIISKAPDVSIVIPVFNALSLTQECIRSIFRETQNIKFEIIVVDNASNDGTLKWLQEEKKKHPHFNVFKMDKNIGFGPAVNFGIRQSNGHCIVILNNDTIVTSGWLNNLLVSLESDPFIGIVSPVTNYVGEGPQIDENARDLTLNLSNIEQYARSIADRSDLIYEPNRLVFFCVLLRHELIDRIGYLDEGYEKGNFEDDDYCLRARMAGYRLAIARNSFVYHHGSATFTKNSISHTRYMESNRNLFYRKAGRIATSSHFLTHWPAKKDDISVIVRTKDRPILLKKALTSLANQTFRQFEVVLVNDGGEDVSEVLSIFGPQFPITYLYNSSSIGRTAAANKAIEHSSGRWISFLDDDDVIYPWHLESLLQATRNNDNKFIYSDYNQALFFELDRHTPDKLVGAPSRDYQRSKLLIQNYIPIHTWLLASECFGQVGLLDETLDRLEDYEFLLRLSKLYNFHHLKKVTCEYRYYLNSANSIYTDRQKSLDALQHIYQLYPFEDTDMMLLRQEVLNTLKNQIQSINDIKKKSETTLSDAVAMRRIIRLVTGM